MKTTSTPSATGATETAVPDCDVNAVAVDFMMLIGNLEAPSSAPPPDPRPEVRLDRVLAECEAGADARRADFEGRVAAVVHALDGLTGSEIRVVLDRATGKKDRVSDKTFDRLGPEMLRLLLRPGFRSCGMRSPDLAAQLACSRETVLRIAQRFDELGLARCAANSGRGGRGTLIRVVSSRVGDAEEWVRQHHDDRGVGLPEPPPPLASRMQAKHDQGEKP